MVNIWHCNKSKLTSRPGRMRGIKDRVLQARVLWWNVILFVCSVPKFVISSSAYKCNMFL
jgi:hypothetical protein